MFFKAVAWMLLAAMSIAAIALFNYWASFQPVSTLVYSGIVLAFCGLANVAIPFRLLGIRKRAVGALIFASGVTLTFAALFWPASTTRVAQHRSHLDDILPEYQFREQHSLPVHAKPEQVMEATREATWSDLKSLITLLKIRGAIAREPYRDTGAFSQNCRIFDAFAASGSLFDSSGREIVMFNAANVQPTHRPDVHTPEQFAAYHDPGWIKTAFDFRAEDLGGGWSRITTETRMAVQEGYTRGPAIYWRLILPGSGLLRREWLDGIKRRAENMTTAQPSMTTSAR